MSFFLICTENSVTREKLGCFSNSLSNGTKSSSQWSGGNSSSSGIGLQSDWSTNSVSSSSNNNSHSNNSSSFSRWDSPVDASNYAGKNDSSANYDRSSSVKLVIFETALKTCLLWGSHAED